MYVGLNATSSNLITV